MRIDNPAKLPDEAMIKEWREPIVRATIIIPAEFIGPIMSLCQERRGVYIKTEYISKTRVIIHYKMPVRGDRVRLLRQAQVDHARLRHARLPHHRVRARPTSAASASWWPGTRWTP
jgi:hypothetical protein